MGRKKLTIEQKKTKLSITINRFLVMKITESQPNMSKYIEFLVYNDLKKNNIIDKTMLL